MKILVNTKEEIIAVGYDMIRCDFQDEKNLIRINLNENPFEYYYVGTFDRDDYIIITVDNIPEDYKDGKYLYQNNDFVLNEKFENI